MKYKLDNYLKLTSCEICEKTTNGIWSWIVLPNKQIKKFLCLECHNYFAVKS